jgi:rhodanese-related sulfurtransferase
VLAIALGYGAAGAAVGGIFGAMHGLGVSENEARDYEKEFNQGRAIVAVRAGQRSGEAAYILQRHGAFNLKKESNCPVPTMGKGDS